jgi:membrane-associated protein
LSATFRFLIFLYRIFALLLPLHLVIMEEWLQHLLGLLPVGAPYYALLAGVAFFEAVILMGWLLPGSALVIGAGYLVLHGQGALLPLMAAVGVGAFFGDLTSYILGARLGSWLLHKGPLRRRLGMVRKAEVFFAGHGGKSLFFGRFLGPLRGTVPFVAGGARMRPGSFLAYTTASCVLWGIAYPGLGFLGGASWQQVQRLTGRFSLFIGLLLMLLIAWHYFRKHYGVRTGQWLRQRWSRDGKV